MDKSSFVRLDVLYNGLVQSNPKSLGITIFFLRLSLGWVFLYAGLSKILDHSWSSAGYLAGAKTLSGFYTWLALPQNIGWVNFLSEWGLFLIGLALILGALVRPASIFGIILIVLFYLPILEFPIVGDHSYLVDEHIVYIFVFAVLLASKAGYYIGIDKYLRK